MLKAFSIYVHVRVCLVFEVVGLPLQPNQKGSLEERTPISDATGPR